MKGLSCHLHHAPPSQVGKLDEQQGQATQQQGELAGRQEQQAS